MTTTQGKESSVFLRALFDVMSGVRQARALAEILVAEAVEHTLQCVSADFPLEYGMLVKQYKDRVVSSCCHTFDKAITTEANSKCGGTTKSGKPCGRNVVAAGFCSHHLGEWQRQRSAQRRATEYAASLARATPDRYEDELRRASARTSVTMVFPTTFVTALL